MKQEIYLVTQTSCILQGTIQISNKTMTRFNDGCAKYAHIS